MTVTSGFFDSVSEDRKYNTAAMNQLFEGLLTDGVIGSVGGQLMVSAGLSGLSVTIASGRAWGNRTWLNNDADFTIELVPANQVYARYDLVMIEFDARASYRINQLVVLTGTPSATPQLPMYISIDDHIYVPLANVLVPANATTVLQQNILNRIGTVDCPFSTSLLQQFTMDGLMSQWSASWYEWFQNIQDQLDDNQAGNLQNQIDALHARLSPDRNILINGHMVVKQRNATPVDVTGFGYFNGVPDRWLINMYNAGSVMPSTEVRTDDGIERTWLKLTSTVAKPSPDPESCLLLTQRIEGGRLKDVLFGTPDAKEIVLSYLFRSNRTGTYVVSLYSIPQEMYVSQSFLYEYADETFKVELTFPANTVVPFDSGNEHTLACELWLLAGSDYASSGSLQITWDDVANQTSRALGQVNMMSSTNKYAAVTDVQLEVGPVVTPYERLSIDTVLTQCQRYYEVISSYPISIIPQRNDGYCRIIVDSYVVPKRQTLPTLVSIIATWYGAPPIGGGITPSGNLTSVSATPNKDRLTGVYGFGLTGTGKVFYGLLSATVSSEL